MLRKVFSQTGANSRVPETDAEDMQNREHSCFFSAAHAAKDSGIALELARNLGLNLPLSRATKDQYDRMIAEGLGDLDKSGIAELTFKDRRKTIRQSRVTCWLRSKSDLHRKKRAFPLKSFQLEFAKGTCLHQSI
jgi:hypothetical protein